MEDNSYKLRLVEGKEKYSSINRRLFIKGVNNPNVKIERTASANVVKKIDFSKSPSPNKGVKKFKVNVNVNLSENK